MLPLLFWKHPFLSKLYILCSSAIKRWLCDNQPLIVLKVTKIIQNIGVRISTIVSTQTIVFVSELTP